MKRKMIAIFSCVALLLTGCASHKTDGAPKGRFKSVSYSVSSMDRTVNAGFLLRLEASGELVFHAGCFISSVEFIVSGAALDAEIANEITRIAAEYQMLARRGKDRQPKIFALDDQGPSFSVSFSGEGETASLDDGYKKPGSFFDGYAEIRDLLYELAEKHFNAFFESYGGRWTADNGAMGRYLEFSLTDEAAGCRSGNPGEQRQRPTADISALELTAEGVYHLSVCYPGEEPDDMDNGREERWEEYYIRPLENGRIAVSGEQGGSETIYCFESGQTA